MLLGPAGPLQCKLCACAAKSHCACGFCERHASTSHVAVTVTVVHVVELTKHNAITVRRIKFGQTGSYG